MSQTLQPASPGALTIASGQSGVFPVSFGYYPAEGSRCVTAVYNWATLTGYVEDLSQLVAKGVETSIQSVFVDNSQCLTPVTITVGGTGQVLVCQASGQGMYPLLFTGTPNYQIATTATGAASVTRLYLLNVPGGVGSWPAQSTQFDTNGNQKVSLYPFNSSQPVVLGANNYNNFGNILMGGVYMASPNEVTSNNASMGLITDSYGGLLVDTEASAPVYSASINLSGAAAPTDLFQINGSATKTIRIHEIQVSCNGSGTWQIVRRSNGNTGGTVTFGVAVPHDANSAAATAAVAFYTGNPALLGTLVGAIETDEVFANTSGRLVYTYGVTDQALVLRGTSQCICLTALSGFTSSTMALKIKWSEV